MHMNYKTANGNSEDAADDRSKKKTPYEHKKVHHHRSNECKRDSDAHAVQVFLFNNKLLLMATCTVQKQNNKIFPPSFQQQQGAFLHVVVDT